MVTACLTRVPAAACAQVATLLVGGSMALKGVITAQQLTSFVMYVEFVTSASLAVCDQWVSLRAPLFARFSPNTCACVPVVAEM